MGIFGHMTSKSPLDKGPPGESGGSKAGGAEDPSLILEKTVDLQSATDEIEKSLEELGSSIEDTINKSAAAGFEKKPEPEPPHFTLATSPTRTRKDD